MIFLAAIKDRGLIIFLKKSCHIDAHLFYEYLVRQSVSHATKGRNVEIKKHDFFWRLFRIEV